MTEADKSRLHAMSLEELATVYATVWRMNDAAVLRDFILNDRFFLLTQVLEVRAAWHPWVLARCREVEADPDEHLDLWSRGHFKSTIITFAGTIQEILRNPEICICIMSYKAGAAEGFSNQIMTAFESNEVLLKCFPDILWSERRNHQGDIWSVSGWSVKRKGVRKECTVNTSGLVSGMLTGGHFDLLIYDDAVTPDSVRSVEMSKTTTDAWSMSLNLGTLRTRHWYIGTRYAVFDTYAEMIKRGIRERRHVGVDATGRPVLLPQAEFDQKRKDMSAKDWASQMMQSPIGAGELLFRDDWWQFYMRRPDLKTMNIYIFVDTATKRAKRNDYTVMWVVGFGQDGNYYVLDLVRDKLSLSQRANAIFDLVERWQPINVFWEANGSRSDGEYLREKMDERSWHFRITEINQKEPKETRVAWLEPVFKNGKIFFPTRLFYQDVQGELHDLVETFKKEEWLIFPSVTHDDMLDSLANIKHPEVQPHVCFPSVQGAERSIGETRRATMERHRGFGN